MKFINQKIPDDVPFFTISGDYKAKIVHCVDGDTVHAVLKYNKKYQKFKIRLLGYNSPELKPPTSDPDRDSIIDKATQAKHRLEELVLNKKVHLQVQGFDAFGRLLSNVLINKNDKKSVNQIMLEEGFGDVF